MSKLKLLSGVAHNLADSFISSTNMYFLEYIQSLPIEKTKLFEIDLLEVTIQPEDLLKNAQGLVITGYKNWFFSELEKLNINISEIEKVTIKVAYKLGKSFGHYYTCTVTIHAKGKVYEQKVMSSYL